VELLRYVAARAAPLRPHWPARRATRARRPHRRRDRTARTGRIVRVEEAAARSSTSWWTRSGRCSTTPETPWCTGTWPRPGGGLGAGRRPGRRGGPRARHDLWLSRLLKLEFMYRVGRPSTRSSRRTWRSSPRVALSRGRGTACAGADSGALDFWPSWRALPGGLRLAAETLLAASDPPQRRVSQSSVIDRRGAHLGPDRRVHARLPETLRIGRSAATRPG